MNASENVIKALAVASELTGTDFSKAAARAIADELAPYPEPQVLHALKRCCAELRSRLTLADILERLPGNHPGAEEAWSICARCLNDERATVIWTNEMALAFGVALGCQGDQVAARMAFKEAYSAAVARARMERKLPVWIASPGTDKDGRELAVLDAVQKGRISLDYARQVLPYHREDVALNARLLSFAGGSLKRLENKVA